MKAARFDYVRAADVAGALAALVQPGAKLVAGGQSLGPMLNLRLARPALLVDVSRLPALQRIEDIGGAWRIGAGVTHARLEDTSLAGAEMLQEVAGGIAYRSVRNRGTIGGSLAHADPAADWPLALAALGAVVNIRGPQARNVGIDRFLEGAFTTALQANELIESIDVPKLSGTGRYAYYKFCRKTGDFADISAAVVLDPQRRIARVLLGALRGTPQQLAALAQRIASEGQAATTGESVAAAIAQALPDLDPIEQRMAATAVTRALARVFAP
jgi:carbon-monoxide dehydrogenase medium subunit